MHSHILMTKPQPSPKSNSVTREEQVSALQYLSLCVQMRILCYMPTVAGRRLVEAWRVQKDS